MSRWPVVVASTVGASAFAFTQSDVSLDPVLVRRGFLVYKPILPWIRCADDLWCQRRGVGLRSSWRCFEKIIVFSSPRWQIWAEFVNNKFLHRLNVSIFQLLSRSRHCLSQSSWTVSFFSSCAPLLYHAKFLPSLMVAFSSNIVISNIVIRNRMQVIHNS